jgi:hypothetical protein
VIVRRRGSLETPARNARQQDAQGARKMKDQCCERKCVANQWTHPEQNGSQPRMPAAHWERCPDWRPPSAPPGLCVRGCAARGADGDGDSAAGSHNPASLVRLSDPGPLAMLAHRSLSANPSLLHTPKLTAVPSEFTRRDVLLGGTEFAELGTCCDNGVGVLRESSVFEGISFCWY